MLSLKTNIEMLTNFIVPIYQSFLNETNNIQESKKNTVDVLVNAISKYSVTDNKIDPYALDPVLLFLQKVIAERLKEISANKAGNKDAIEFYKDLLRRLYQYHEICLKMKKE